jgi:hypothetical protein
MATVAGAQTTAEALGPKGMDWERVRFTASLAIYGAIVGGNTIIVNMLSRAIPPSVPEHLSVSQSIYFGSLSALVSVLIIVPGAWFIYGGRPTFFSDRDRGPRSLPKWLFLGSLYGGIHMLVFGGLFLPMANLWFSFIHSQIDFLQFLYSASDNLFMSPYLSVTVGLQLLFTSILSIVVFGAGAALIDRVNASQDPKTALIGAWTASIILSAALITFIVLAPETTLATLGSLAQ